MGFSKTGPICSGADIGKKRSPSHASVFENRGDLLVQVHQKFLDGWEYTKQVEYFKALIEYFGIDYFYYDNTRGEMEERDLPKRICIPIVFTDVAKRKMANSFSKMVEQQKVKLLSEERFINQILCVTNSLKAPETPQGHGDSFFSVMLAISAFEDHYGSLVREPSRLLDLQNIVSAKEEMKNKDMSQDSFLSAFPKVVYSNKCPFCMKLHSIEDREGKKYCSNCFTYF